MKKIPLIWTLSLLLLTACEQQRASVVPGQWAFYRKAYSFLSVNKDSAFYYFNRSATNTSNKQEAALAYQNMALIQSDAGDDYGAQESLIQALPLLDVHDPANRVHFADDYNQLGITFSNLNNFTQALNYYERAFSYADDPVTKAHLLNNEGNAYKDLKNYAGAIRAYQAALQMHNQDKEAYARVLTNLAFAKWLQDPRYNAAPELLRSLAIRRQQKDTWGENSSYAHLADYYRHAKPDSAQWYAREMLHAATQLRSPDDQIVALRKLIILDPKLKTIYFDRYEHLDDSVQSSRSASRDQFAVIRYNVAEAKTENVQLQKKNNERRYQLLIVIILALIGACVGFWLYQRRKRRMQQENDRRLRESKLKLSQKVHDKVANGIYRIMSEVEHLPELDRIVLLDQLEDMYNISRNVAHDEAESADDFTERINTMLYAFKKASLRLAITGNEKALWIAVGSSIREELLMVLQELMVNMSKHSKATQAFVGFTLADGCLMLSYRDDGIGLGEQKTSGKGLQNTVSRIEALHGKISFDGVESGGLRVLIQLPIIH